MTVNRQAVRSVLWVVALIAVLLSLFIILQGRS